MADVLRRGAHQTVAAFHQLNGGLALAHAAVAQDEDAFAVDLHEHAVTGHAGGQFYVQDVDEGAEQRGSALGGDQQRHLVLTGKLQEFRQNFQPAADDDSGRLQREHLFQMAAAVRLGQLLQIGDLHHAADLDAAGVKILVVPRQHDARTVHIRGVDGDVGQFLGRIDGIHFQGGRKFAQWYGKRWHSEHPFFYSAGPGGHRKAPLLRLARAERPTPACI